MTDLDPLDLLATIREGLLVLEPDLTVRFANRSLWAETCQSGSGARVRSSRAGAFKPVEDLLPEPIRERLAALEYADIRLSGAPLSAELGRIRASRSGPGPLGTAGAARATAAGTAL